MAKTSNKRKLIEQRHSIYNKMAADWIQWRSVYEAGRPFIESSLKQFSKRETRTDFEERKHLAYVPAHVKRVVNSIRNAFACKLPEVQRKGDPQYLKIVNNNIDLKRNNINTFIALETIPLLLVQGRRMWCVDAPPKAEGTTRAEDTGRPYAWAVNAEDILSWANDDDTGALTVCLMRECAENFDPDTGLVDGETTQYRFCKMLKAGEKYFDQAGPGVVVRILDEKGDDKVEPVLLKGWERLPVVDMWLPMSIVADIATHQVALLQLASTDMTFLFRGNFPIFTKQHKANKRMTPPVATKRVTSPSEHVVSDQSRDVDEEEKIGSTKVGVSQGVGYEEGLNAPAFIAPPTENMKASMEKQKALAEEIQVLMDMALTTLAVKAMEQSGKSKEMDQIGKDQGLFYLGLVCQTAENELAEVLNLFNGVKTKQTEDLVVTYPTDYQVKTQSERNIEADELNKAKKLVNSKTYQKTVDKRIAEIVTKPFAKEEELNSMKTEIDAAMYIDDNEVRAAAIIADKSSQLVTAETASVIRGYPPEEATKVADQQKQMADLLSGGEVDPATGEPIDEEEEPELDEDGKPIKKDKGAPPFGPPKNVPPQFAKA